ncbi:uncharacterized protein LOC116727801 isoform X1 [Xiphophorus hellerii]|uniref:uncharacterized protein LOC116727801 isoform X1 n=1 Tax=Xiphophorus hellerii TaxID=8084 RepID=UPI0013B429F6|nr:uncharacterized protein LOC116727801 isoform X1 [Xiphophorus hellerii]XP_032431310.1 uncharacterized protein LOC116727801 isoform X1 [Xiphophorus hellerii]
MSNISEDEWRDTMTKIFEKLEVHQFRKMKELLNKSGYDSPTKMTTKFKMELPKNLIQRFGAEESIRLVNKAMKEIPRNDAGVQDLLRPFMDKLKKQEEGRDTSSQPKTDSDGAEKPEQNQGASSGPAHSPQKMFKSDVTKTIRDLKAGGGLGQKVLTVKVVHKSDLYENPTRTKFYFHLGVADETDAIKVVVFGSERFPDIKKDHFYTIRYAVMDHKEKVLKIAERTKMSETGPFEVPRNVELEAEKLIFSPVYSIRDIQSLGDKKEVSVKGTVKEIGVIKSMEMRAKPEKRDKQAFELEDGTGSITVDLWGEDTKHLSGISNGDVVLVNNLKTNLFNNRVSLNSTNSTRITKVQSALVQSVNITILGISKVDLISAELEVQINGQVKTLEVSCPLLAEGLGLRLEDDFRAKLLEKVPFPAEAQIQGNKIKQLKAAA